MSGDFNRSGFDYVATVDSKGFRLAIQVTSLASVYGSFCPDSGGERSGGRRHCGQSGVGGKGAAVYMEGTGLFVSAYNLLTLSVGERYGVPMLLIVAFVGSFEDQRNSSLFSHYGIKTIGLLKTLGIEHVVVDSGEYFEERVKDAVRMMDALKLRWLCCSPVSLPSSRLLKSLI